ncbi:hypothetical protein WN51_07937 [Melipona quadrifasciata]|uniref:Uncharacterized protein n=1 Tax=Melipona quadrifasciata TaxID=166423 RepID=A0A0M8ZNZ3_9HYME|nr:hypothetical protein WN51_07937 [Melipona quadrifasciata]
MAARCRAGDGWQTRNLVSITRREILIAKESRAVALCSRLRSNVSSGREGATRKQGSLPTPRATSAEEEEEEGDEEEEEEEEEENEGDSAEEEEEEEIAMRDATEQHNVSEGKEYLVFHVCVHSSQRMSRLKQVCLLPRNHRTDCEIAKFAKPETRVLGEKGKLGSLISEYEATSDHHRGNIPYTAEGWGAGATERVLFNRRPWRGNRHEF